MTIDEAIDAPSTRSATRGLQPQPQVRDRDWRRYLVPAAAVLVGLAGGWWFVLRDDGGTTATGLALTRQVETATVGTMADTVTADGTVAAAQTDDLSFSSAGSVTAVNVKAGDTVASGQVLASIDAVELQSSLTAAQSDLASAQAKLSDDKSSGASSEQIDADEASVTAATDSVTSAYTNLGNASLVASFDGTVASVDLTVGEQLGSGGSSATSATGSATGSGLSSSSIGSNFAGGPNAAANSSSADSSSSSAQIQVVSAGRYSVDLSFGSSDIDQIKVGQSASVTVSSSSGTNAFPGFGGGGGFPGFPGGNANANGNGSGSGTANGAGATGASAVATGTVTEVGAVASASSGVATYPVTVTFDTDSKDVYVGSSVSAAITTTERTNVLQVPSQAITTSNGTSTVLVAKDGTADGPTETRTVEVGVSLNGQTEITSGLSKGDKVIVSVPDFAALRNGGGTGGLPNGFPGGGASGTQGTGQ
jgi:multidrug efflux pump subunit AcrA (membrane-fusion protein)